MYLCLGLMNGAHTKSQCPAKFLNDELLPLVFPFACFWNASIKFWMNCAQYAKWSPFVELFDWLIIYCFTSRSRIFHLYGDVTIAGKGLQNLGLCLVLRAFQQGGIFIVPHLLWHGTSTIFPVSSEGLPHVVASYDTRGDVEDLF
jgi:hypothetical protein